MRDQFAALVADGGECGGRRGVVAEDAREGDVVRGQLVGGRCVTA
jgi:hypothetical protein